MTAVKTAKTYTLEELKEKAGLALNVPALVEIVRTVPNLTQVRDKAYQHVVEQTHDLKDAKKLADSARFLAMLRRDFKEEFEKLIAHEKQPEPESETLESKKEFRDIRFVIPPGTESIVTDYGEFAGGVRPERTYTLQHTLRFVGAINWSPKMTALGFCMNILNALSETETEEDKTDYYGSNDLLNNLIQFLEEKFGLKIRICEYCNYFTPNFIPNKGCDSLGKPNYNCSLWTPKEISGKPSSA